VLAVVIVAENSGKILKILEQQSVSILPNSQNLEE
jgi:hypothetical protein